jgi:hypothetical protein
MAPRHLSLAAGAALSLTSAVALQAGRDARYPDREVVAERVLYTRSGASVRRLALAYQALASDVYWIRTIQHYGGDRLAADGRRKYELLQPLLDLTTTLDPLFSIAYRFGAIFLSEAPPGGPGRPDQAIALLEKGLAAQPDRWEYMHDIAFVQFWHLHDPVTAAAWFQRAGAVRDAPPWLQPLAATMLSANDRSSARTLWLQIRASDQPWLRRTAERSLLQLQALDQIDELTALIQRHTTAGARVTWADLVRARVVPGVPLDPTGVAYVLDIDTARVSVSPRSTLSPMPDLTSRLR